MKKFLFFNLFLIFFCCDSLLLSAQEISAVYDFKTSILTINNQKDLCVLKAVDSMPKQLLEFIGNTGEKRLEYGEIYTISNITQEHMEKWKTIIVYLRDAQNNFNQRYDIVIQIKNQPNNSTAFDIEELSLLQPLYIYITIGTVVVFVVVFVIIFSRKKRKKTIFTRNDNPVIQIIEEEKNDYKNGLEYIRRDSNNYFLLDLEEYLHDTAVKKVYFAREVIKKINGYFKEFLEHPDRTNETGCYLIGGWENVNSNQEQYNISIEEMVIPGDDAVYDEYSLNFGLKIGIKLGSDIQNLCEKTGRDYVHTAWMHSHPGLGLFLSSHDLVVQKQLAYEDAPKRTIALVIDTNTPDWQMAIFSPKNNGIMNNKEDLIQTISFDILNDWSRHKQTKVTAPLSFENTYIVESDDTKEKFAFSAKIINQLDDFSYEENADNVFYCYGEFHRIANQRIWKVNTCEDGKQDKVIGCFFMANENDPSFNEQKYTGLLNENEFCMVLYDENMSLQFIDENNAIHVIHASLKDMKEWTRRKRI